MPLRPLPPPARPGLPRALARRIDRLARRAHAFHRFAHHPLCDAYARELVRIGRRTRLCRGCLLALLGSASGLLAGFTTRPSAPGVALALALAVALAAMALRVRVPKFLGRLAPAAAGGFAAGGGPLAAACAAALLLAWVVSYRRRRPDRSACVACPERVAPLCSGLSPQVRRERAFQRLAARWIEGGRSAAARRIQPPEVRRW